jgi:hypothetical protein
VRRRADEDTVLRTVPSAGNRHALETYLAVQRVNGSDEFVIYLAPVGKIRAHG